MLFLIVLLGFLFFGLIYFIPSFVAISRKHYHVLQITILNTFLGWSFLAWVAALIWATTKNTDCTVSTRGSKIIILVCFILLLLPPVILKAIPDSYRAQTMHEMQIKQTQYTLDNGKIKEFTKVKNIKYED